VAVGWYLYTTFVASTATQGRLSISNAEFSNGQLRLFITNPGPQAVTVKTVVLNGQTCASEERTFDVGDSYWYEASCSGVSDVPRGTMLPGYVTTTAGTTFPFNAIVR
jgi:hypothetical protein